MDIRWTALAQVAAVSFAASVGIVLVFTLGVLSAAAAREHTSGDTLARAASGLCFAACAAVVAYGIWLIVPRFH